MDKNFQSKYSRIFQSNFKNASVMIQGCIGPNGVGRLVQCDQRMNATCSASLLQETLSESIPDIYVNLAKNVNFQHHNAALQRAELTQNYFDRSTLLLQCFAQSSDLNRLESVWLCIKNQLNNDARCPPMNKDNFIQRVDEVWTRIS